MAITKKNTYVIGSNNDLSNALLNVDLNRIGTDLTQLELDTVPKVSIGSVIEAEGSIYVVDTAAVTPSGTAEDGAYLFFDPSGPSFAWSTTPGTYDAERGGIYDGSDRRQCGWVLASPTTFYAIGSSTMKGRRWVFRSGSGATFTAPINGRYRARAYGGGAGGGSSATGAGTPGGGGSGGYSAHSFLLAEGDTLTYTVGSGGSGGTAGGDGSDGGDTTISDGSLTVTATGGSGGEGTASSSSPWDGGAGGRGSTDEAETNQDGEYGGDSVVATQSGYGGGGPGASREPGKTTNVAGGAGNDYGGGGSGGFGFPAVDGGEGADGAVIIEIVG